MITKKENHSVKKFSALMAVLFGGALLSLGFQGVLSSAIPFKNQGASLAEASPEQKKVAEDPFAKITLEARAVFVYDLTTGKTLFSKNENEKLPLASITKIMTTLVARDHTSSGMVVTLTKDDLSAEGDTGLRPGERWRMADLLDVMLIVSSNDAAHAVASFVGSNGQSISEGDEAVARTQFIKMMNEKAHQLGFNSMEFFNESGLDISGVVNERGTKNARDTAGGYGSARDVSLLFSELWKKYPTAVEITTHKDARITSQNGIAHILPNTDEALGHFPGVIGSKTGYTTLAGGNLAIIFDVGIGHPVVAVVLGSTYNGRFEDMVKLVKATLKTLK